VSNIDDATSAVLFRVLGPLEVHAADGPIRLPPGRQEIVLAALVLNLGRVVDSAYLVDLVWPQNPPETARTQVQFCVSRLRKALSGTGATIETQAYGYRLIAPAASTDADEFRRLVGDAREAARAGRKVEAVQLLRGAAGLWRDRCLAGIPSDALARAAAQLDESRIEALETCLALELELGRHNLLVSELRGLIGEHPLRERLRGFLMVALHRSGRQAEALATYRQARELFAEELGLDPGKELRDLASAILADDPALVVDAEPEPAEQHRPSAERVTATDPVNIPRQLPAGVGDLVADGEFVDAIRAAVVDAQERPQPGPVLLTGGPGVGKSTMAVHVAHLLAAERFPGGQLYCDLHGSSGQPVEPGNALGRFLRALGLPGQAVPESLDERAEMYRNMLADRRILVVLDDAGDEEQVRPLLPGSGRSVVLVTSSRRLTALPGAQSFGLEPLGPDRAVELLGRVIGEARVSAEVETAQVLVRLVGGLPLALRIIAARLGARPHWSLASMVHRLENEHRRLDELVHGELSMRASLKVSYDGLAMADRRLLCLLALADGTSIPSWAGAALTDDRGPEPADLLEPLVDMRLLEITAMDPSGDFRCALPQTVHMFASDRLAAEVSGTDREAAVRRLAGAWTALVEQAHRRVYGGLYTIVPGHAAQWQLPTEYARRHLHDPLAWLDGEHANLAKAVDLAARSGLDESCWQLATMLVTLFEVRGYAELWESTHRVALQAVREAGNLRGQAAVLRSLGALHLSRGEYEAADPFLATALSMFDEMDEPSGRALCLRDQALISRQSGAEAPALTLYEQAERYFVAAGDIIGQAHVLGEAAFILMRRSHFTSARSYLDKALGICRSAGFDRGQAMALRRLGQMQTYQREFAAAERTLLEVLAMVRASGDLVGEGHLLLDLGRINAQAGRAEPAIRYLTQSVNVRERILDKNGAAAVRTEIGTLLDTRVSRTT
jgi:DNA-binding SARP family transcriptional activator